MGKLYPSRDPNIPHPGLMFTGGRWRSLEAQERYNQSEARKKVLRRYNASEKGRANRRRYDVSDKGRATQARHNHSLNGVQNRHRYEGNRILHQGNQKLQEAGLLG